MNERVTGTIGYSLDFERPGMLHGKIVRSLAPHAEITAVALEGELPEGCVLLTPADVADVRPYGCLVPDTPVLAAIARYTGDPVAAVAAPSRHGRAPRAGGRARVGRPAGGDRSRRRARRRRAARARRARGRRAPRAPGRACARSPAPMSRTASTSSAGAARRASTRPTSSSRASGRRPRRSTPRSSRTRASRSGRTGAWPSGRAPRRRSTCAASWRARSASPRRRARRLAADGRLVRGQDVHAHRGHRRRARAQGGGPGQARALARGAVPHAQPPPDALARPSRSRRATAASSPGACGRSGTRAPTPTPGPNVAAKGGWVAVGPYRFDHVEVDADCVYTNHPSNGAFAAMRRRRRPGPPSSASTCSPTGSGIDPLELRLRTSCATATASRPARSCTTSASPSTSSRSRARIGWAGDRRGIGLCALHEGHADAEPRRGAHRALRRSATVFARHGRDRAGRRRRSLPLLAAEALGVEPALVERRAHRHRRARPSTRARPRAARRT